MQRLSKILAQCGIASRRAAETLIFDGKVKVNGAVVKIPQTLADIQQDTIEVEGQILQQKEVKLYFMLNKPKGYVCSTRVDGKSKSVLTLFADEKARLFTVGRLDKDTEGLLLVTNDGHWAHQVIHPSSNISKEYLAKTDLEITAEHLHKLSKGAWVEGVFVRPLKVRKVRRGTLKIAISEGKKREVRMLMENAGLPVLELTRIRIGGLQLGTLPVGGYRPLTKQDFEQLFKGATPDEA